MRGAALGRSPEPGFCVAGGTPVVFDGHVEGEIRIRLFASVQEVDLFLAHRLAGDAIEDCSASA